MTQGQTAKAPQRWRTPLAHLRDFAALRGGSMREMDASPQAR
jgi:hypothetical protein